MKTKPYNRCPICDKESLQQPCYDCAKKEAYEKGRASVKCAFSDEDVEKVGFALYNFIGQERTHLESHEEYEEQARSLLASLNLKTEEQCRAEGIDDFCKKLESDETIQAVAEAVNKKEAYGVDTVLKEAIAAAKVRR